MKKPKPRWHNEQELLDRMNRLRSAMARRFVNADTKDGEAAVLEEQFNKVQPDKWGGWEHQAQSTARRLRGEARRLRLTRVATENHILDLGKKLAEMKTEPFGFIPDRSVQQ